MIIQHKERQPVSLVSDKYSKWKVVATLQGFLSAVFNSSCPRDSSPVALVCIHLGKEEPFVTARRCAMHSRFESLPLLFLQLELQILKRCRTCMLRIAIYHHWAVLQTEYSWVMSAYKEVGAWKGCLSKEFR